jgi:hypothetical protein
MRKVNLITVGFYCIAIGALMYSLEYYFSTKNLLKNPIATTGQLVKGFCSNVTRVKGLDLRLSLQYQYQVNSSNTVFYAWQRLGMVSQAECEAVLAERMRMKTTNIWYEKDNPISARFTLEPKRTYGFLLFWIPSGLSFISLGFFLRSKNLKNKKGIKS